MKYVMFKVEKDGLVRKLPIIFPDALTHKDVARRVQGVEGLRGAQIASAGFVRFELGSAHCHGDSETLQLAADPDDSRIINGYDYFHGIVS